MNRAEPVRLLMMAAGLPLVCLPVACSELRAPPDYYGDAWDPPTVASLSPDSQAGNVGGGLVEITGSGFGEDPGVVVVVVGDQNATVVEIADSRLLVELPAGPLAAGAVDVKVGTPTGYAVAEDAYTYDLGDLYADERAYIQVSNYWESCLGGLSDRLDRAYRDELGGLCETVAYVGASGLAATSEGFGDAYPRVHTPSSGWFLGGDVAGPEWTFERPGLTLFPSGLDDLHDDIGEIVFHNAFYAGQDPWCADLDTLASYRYGGGLEGAWEPYTVYPYAVVEGEQQEACDPGETPYDLSELRFCTGDDADGAATHLYEADWPVVKNFFAGHNRQLVPGEVTVDVPERGIVGQRLAIPEPLAVFAEQGFEDIGDPTATGDLWTLLSLGNCFDDDGNGERLDDVALAFTWAPATFEPVIDGALVDVQTYVRFTLTEVAYGWLGPVNYPLRATITVPDDYEYRDRTGVSRLEVPAEVLYQFPTIRLPATSGPSGAASLFDPADPTWGYLVLTVERVTEYALRPEGEGAGRIVLAYVTGDLGIFGWENPNEADACHNCVDDDGDGLIDAEDPGCSEGADEDEAN